MKRKVIKFLAVVLILFLAYNVFWFAATHYKYGKYKEGLDRQTFGSYVHFSTEKDPFNYGVTFPGWLDYEGCLTVNHNEKNKSLFIWPSVFSDKVKYGLRYKGDGEKEFAADIVLDRDYNISKNEGYTDEELKLYRKKIKEDKKEIDELFEKANKEFGI